VTGLVVREWTEFDELALLRQDVAPVETAK
jgi:hypothetical protein